MKKIDNKKCIKFIAFDLDTKQLKMFMDRYQTAYEKIKKFMLDNNFKHEQGSCYISNIAMTHSEIQDIVEDLNNKYDWFAPSVKKLCVTDVGRKYDLAVGLRDDNVNFNSDVDYEEVNGSQVKCNNNLKNKTKLIKR